MKLDTVFMVVNIRTPGIVYAAPGITATEAWENARKAAFITVFNSKTKLMRDGWRARRVDIALATKAKP